MSKYIDIDVKIDGIVKDISDLRRHLRLNIQNAVDKELDASVDELKAELISIMSSEVRTSSTIPNAPTNIPEKLNIPKADTDILKEVFDVDVKDSQIFKTGNIVDDSSNVFIVKNGRIKAWQSVSDSSTYEQQEDTFRNRLKKGVVIDAKSGKIYKVDPDTVKGMKLECSRDTGQTVDSTKKFEAYKNSTHVSRRKNNAPYDRTAVWTVRQEDVHYMMDKAIDLKPIIELIQNDDLSIAKQVINTYNKDGSLDSIISNIDNIQEGNIKTEGFQNYKTIKDMVNNIKIRKRISATGTTGPTTYTLFTRYDRTDSEEEVEFFSAIKMQTWLWMTKNEKRWLDAVIKSIENAIIKYDPKSKFL